MIVIADDLTGANDTAVQYCKMNVPAVVDVGLEKDGKNSNLFADYEVVSVNTDSRAMTASDAYAAVYSACKTFCGTDNRIYKKIDSLLRGNPGIELDAVMDALNLPIAIVAPSYPVNDRIVKDGILYAGNKKIDAVKTLSDGMKRTVRPVSLTVVRLGYERLARFIIEQQASCVQVFVCDAETDSDLQIIYEASLAFDSHCVLCGSAGLAAFDAKHVAESVHAFGKAKLEKRNGLILMVTGSRSEKTRLQIEKASAEYNSPYVMLDKNLIINKESARAVEKCLEQIRARVSSGSKVIFVCMSSLFEDFKMVLKDSTKNYRIAYELSDCLGQVAGQVFEEFGASGFVLNGGDTTMQLCRHLGVIGIEPVAEAAPGAPVGIFVGGKADRVPVITKSGAFGGEDVTVKCINFLEEYRKD